MRLTVYEPENLAPQVVRDVMTLAASDVPDLGVVRAWTRNEQLLAYDWAMREHLAASDGLARRRERPAFTRAPGGGR